MGDDLIAAHGEIAALMPYLHLPVQSGSDRILDAMNRQHTSDDYRRIVERIRFARGDLALSSDFIVGFPGETDRDFEATLQLVRDVTFASAFSFKYSSRPGTPAAAARKQIPDDVKDARLQALQALLLDATGRRSTRPAPAVRWTCCSKSPAATPARPSAAAPICNPCMSRTPRI